MCQCDPALNGHGHQGGELKQRAEKYTQVDWTSAYAEDPEKTDWLVEPVLEAGSLNALFAKPGTGKSLITLTDLVMRIPGHTVYLDDENTRTQNVSRLKSAGIPAEKLSRLHMYWFQGLPPLDTAEGGLDVEALAVERDAKLVVIDTASRFISGYENDSATYLKMYNHTLKRLRARGIAVLRLDHPGKDGSKGMRGSSAKEGDVDTIWELTAETDSGLLLSLKCLKSRSGHVTPGTASPSESTYARCGSRSWEEPRENAPEV